MFAVTVKDKIILFLTKLFIRNVDGKYKETIEYNYESFSTKVFIFTTEAKNYNKLGQTTPWGTIIMPERICSVYSKNVIDYIFLHELGHARVNAIYRLFFHMFHIGTLALSLFIGLYPNLLFTPLVRFGFMISLFLLSMFSVWINELNAELWAYHTIGKNIYLEVLSELFEKKGKTEWWYNILRIYLRYPPWLFWYFAERNR